MLGGVIGTMVIPGIGRYCEHGKEPFIVYGLSATYYPGDWFGSGSIEQSRLLEGSGLIISSGLQEPCIGSDSQNTRVVLEGIHGKYVKVVSRFVERAVAAFVPPDQRVLLYWAKGHPSYPGPVSAARHAGFDVLESEKSVLCAGLASALGGLRWLKNNPGKDIRLMVLEGDGRSLESGLREAVAGEGVATCDFWNAFCRAALLSQEHENARLRVFAGIGYAGNGHAFIAMRQTDVCVIEQVLRAVSGQLEIQLYRAEADTTDPYFGLLSGQWWEWRSIPTNWRWMRSVEA